ncbi:MAG: SBBP repeat-containing protein [Nitrospirae bacterium]|nr:SBBP repeat-containing protein [Nitrospirota bacterium]
MSKLKRTCVVFSFLFLFVTILSCGSDGGGSTDNPMPAATTKAITAFSFTSPASTGIINESAKTISVTVPYGTNVTALVATFTTTGASVKVGITLQLGGTTPNDFTSTVTYTVTAADSSTATYTVTVTIAASSAKTITAFSFSSPVATGVINEITKTISVTVPNGTIVTALIASFATTGASVKVGTTLQVSGTTPNDFTNPIIYTVTAADNSTVMYTVTVVLAPDTSPPAVISSSPAGNEISVSLSTTVTVTFSELVNVSTVNATTFTLSDGVNPVSGTVSCSGSMAIFTPSSPLLRNKTYTATISSGIKDIDGNATATNYTWSFKSAWTIQIGTSASDGARDIVFDASENIYMIGNTEGNFDGHTNGGYQDVFLIKYNASGVKQWSKQYGTSGVDYANNVALDVSGNIYVAGWRSGSGIVVDKFDSSGTTIMSTTLWNGGDTAIQSVAIDSTGNIYVSSTDKFVQANPAGVVQWSRSVGTTIYGLTVDSNDNVYVTGSTDKDIRYGYPLISKTLFVAKYNSAGTQLLATQCGLTVSTQAYNVAIDNSGNIYAVGILVDNLNKSNWIIDKYNSSGSEQWLKIISGVEARDVVIDTNGDLFVVGTTYQAGNAAGTLMKFDASGNNQWSRTIKTFAYPYGIALDTNGNAYVAGDVSDSLDGNIYSGWNDAFIVKFDSAGVKQ